MIIGDHDGVSCLIEMGEEREREGGGEGMVEVV